MGRLIRQSFVFGLVICAVFAAGAMLAANTSGLVDANGNPIIKVSRQ